MSAGDDPDSPDTLSQAERRLAQHLELLRASPPESPPVLVPRVIRRVRWQRAVRDPLVLVGTVVAAMADSLGILVQPPAGES